MKRILLFLCFLTSIVVSAQTSTAVQDGNWEDASTWDATGVPQAGYHVVIPTQMEVTMNSGTSISIASLTIGGTNARLRQKTNTALTITGDLNITRSQDGYFFDGGSDDTGTLILQGNIINDRRMRITKQLPAENQWHLFSFGFRASRHAEIFSSTTFATNVSNTYSFATYDGSQAAGSKYVYPFNTSSSFTNSDSDITTDGKGYSLKTAAAASTNVVWRAKFHTADVSIAISDAGDQFNLLGNPFPAFLHANQDADATNNLLTVNNAILDEATIWLWNGATQAWETKNQTGAFRINPMQGFFVKAKAGGGNFSFTEAMQSHTKTDNFFKSSSNPLSIQLKVTEGKNTRNTSVFYYDNKTIGFDNGYDSSTFGGYAAAFEVYTELVEENSSKKLAIQSLPTNYEELVVPVGIKVSEEKEYTISADALNLPEGIKVYLEDRLLGTFTRLDESGADYKVILSGETKGRFFLHTKSSSALSADSELLNSVKIYKNGINSLRITGLSTGKASVKIYNVLGTQVFSKSFSSRNVNDIELPKVNTSVYIVQLDTEKGSLNKKIVLE